MINKRLASLLSVTTSFTLLMVSGIFGASKANAVSITSSNGVPTGINDLNVSGQKYDVDFVFGTFADVFGNPMLQPGWTPPTLSANVQPNVPNPPIQQATDAVVAQLNDGSNLVAGGNSGTQRNYFVTGGLRNDINDADELQIFYGQLNSQGEWVSKDVTCNYDITNNPLSSQLECSQTLDSFGITFNSSSLQAIKKNPTNYFFTQPKVMFAKYTPESVPEPITILGTVVAGGMGVAIKRKQKNKTAA